MLQKSLTGIAVVLLAAGAVWYLWPKSCPALDKGLAALRDEATQLQQDGKDDDALKKWNEFLSQLPEGECFAGERTAASQSISEIEKRQGPEPPVTEIPGKSIPPGFKPLQGEVERAANFYQVGRRIQSLANLSTSGEGVFSDWGFKSSRHFAYLHRVPFDTRVVENENGKRIVFEQTIGDLAELMAVSQNALQLEPPNSPILEALAEEFDRRVAPYSWQYRIVRDLVVALQKLDPNLKRTLTGFQGMLRMAGVPVANASDVTYIARVKELAGTRVRLEYVVGLGVTDLKVLDGKQFPKETLQRFMYDVNVAADFVLAKELEAAQDQPFKIRAEEFGSLLSLNCEAAGELELLKTMPGNGADPNVDLLKVVGGRLKLTDKSGQRGNNGEVTPKPGSYLKYDRRKHLVTEAEFEWKIESAWKSGDHLFFQAEQLSGIQAKSSYRAVSLTEERK